ncbi:MAG: Spy/CpxP family protein refolding chaperone [Reyranellales bacterium]
MSYFSRPIALSARSIAIAALVGTTMLASPLVVLAQTAAPMTAEAPATKAETVEQRIANLHATLKITASEEGSWNAVARVMRENAAAWDVLSAERKAQDQQSMTAMDDLKSYSKFAQAHIDGLKNLTSTFGTLYDSMPADQQKVADQVFKSFAHKGPVAQK